MLAARLIMLHFYLPLRSAISCPLVLSVPLWFHPSAGQSQERLEFTRLLAHWAEYDHPDYLPFVFEAEPDVVQLGFYGGHFWSLAHTPAYKGYPAHFPVQGLDECGDWFEEKNQPAARQEHQGRRPLQRRVPGRRPRRRRKGPTGFFKFYRDLWDEKELGPRPVADPTDDAGARPDGKPIGQDGYGIGGMNEYWACLRNPALAGGAEGLGQARASTGASMATSPTTSTATTACASIARPSSGRT